MSSRPHIIVIGAGLIGLSTADSLLRRDCEVTVLEVRPGPMEGASHANSGMLHPSQARGRDNSAPDNVVRAVHDLATWSVDLTRRRMAEMGLDESLSRPIGCYKIYPDIDTAKDAKTQYGRDGIEVNLVPDMSQTFSRPALYFPGDRSADARQYGVALEKRVRSGGATIIYGAKSLEISLSDAGEAVLSLGEHRFLADDIVVACGAQSASFFQALDLRLPTVGVKGWSVDFQRPESIQLPSIPVMDAVSHSAMTPYSDRIRLSGTWNESSPRPLLSRWADIAPDMLSACGAPIASRSGFRPVSSIGRPLIGKTRYKRLWVNSGHGHMGWTLCAASGDLLAQLMTDGHVDENYSIFTDI